MEAKKLINLIEAVFPLAPLPQMSLQQAQLADQSMSRAISEQEWAAAGNAGAGRSWKDFGDEEIMTFDAALSHLDEISFVYYLPAFLLFAVRHHHANILDPEDTLVNSAVFSVTHRSPYSLSRYKRFSTEQKAAVIAFLEFMAKNGTDSERSAEKALKRYWKTDEASKPLIIVL